MSALLTPDQVEIADGLTVADLETIEDFEMALLTLTRDIGRIEEQLDDDTNQDGAWAARAESGLRFKKALRQQLTAGLADLRRAQRAAAAETKAQMLVSQFKADWPVQFEMSLERVKATEPRE